MESETPSWVVGIELSPRSKGALQFARWLRGWPVIPDQMLNLVAGEYTASDPAG